MPAKKKMERSHSVGVRFPESQWHQLITIAQEHEARSRVSVSTADVVRMLVCDGLDKDVAALIAELRDQSLKTGETIGQRARRMLARDAVPPNTEAKPVPNTEATVKALDALLAAQHTEQPTRGRRSRLDDTPARPHRASRMELAQLDTKKETPRDK
jgi:hypothetical protein